jgi:hypothetical protein
MYALVTGSPSGLFECRSSFVLKEEVNFGGDTKSRTVGLNEEGSDASKESHVGYCVDE